MTGGKTHKNLQYSIRLLRLRDWWDKWLHLAGAAFLFWIDSGRIGITEGKFIAYIAAVIFLLIGGYAMNAAADFPQDRGAGRTDPPQQKHSLILSIVSLVIGLILILIITNEALPLMITAATILLGLEYSLLPMRFKERGIWGPITGSVIQKPALFLIFIAILSVWNWLSLILLAWLFFSSMLGMLGHQVLDYKNDLKTGVHTFAVRYSPRLALILSIVFAALISMTIMVPLIFYSFLKALTIMCLLVVCSSVYAIKGLKSIKKIREAVSHKNSSTFTYPSYPNLE